MGFDKTESKNLLKENQINGSVFHLSPDLFFEESSLGSQMMAASFERLRFLNAEGRFQTTSKFNSLKFLSLF